MVTKIMDVYNYFLFRFDLRITFGDLGFFGVDILGPVFFVIIIVCIYTYNNSFLLNKTCKI